MGSIARTIARATLGLAAFLPISATSLHAQSVTEIVGGMYAAAERQAAAIQNYTLSQRVLGMEVFSYFERETLDGHPVFRLQMSDGSGFSFGLGGDEIGLGDVFIYGPKLIEHARYAGQEQIGAFPVHVLTVDDSGAAEIAPPHGPDDVQYRAKAVRVYVDVNMMIPRRIVLEGDAMTDTGPEPLNIQLDFQNIIPIESLLVPFRTTLTIAGTPMDVTIAEVLIDAGRPSA